MSETSPRPDPGFCYLWYDTEYTTLDVERALLLQVSMVATDASLRRLLPPEEDFNCIVRLPEGVTCDPWVESNLADLLRRSRSPESVPVADVNTRLAAYVDRIFGPPSDDPAHRPALAGNSLHADWFLARRFLPLLIARVNFRSLDVTSWKLFWKNHYGSFVFDKKSTELLKQYFPGEFNTSASNHDAHFDVLSSISELNFYRTHQQLTWREPPPSGNAVP